jgi:hypothetical protein
LKSYISDETATFKFQNVLFVMPTNALKAEERFVMPTNALKAEERFNSFVCSMGFRKTYPAARSCSSLSLLDTDATILTTITETVYAGNALCGKTVIHIRIRTKPDIALSI